MSKETEEVKEKEQVKVEVLSVGGQSALVKFKQHGKTKQVYVPKEAIDLRSNKIALEDLEAGAPYGIPFADLIELKATPKKIEEALHKAGIYTLEDMKKKSKMLPGILQSVYALDMATLFRVANQYHKEK